MPDEPIATSGPEMRRLKRIALAVLGAGALFVLAWRVRRRYA